MRRTKLKRTIRLIATDLDYTLLNNGFEISQRNRSAIARAVRGGAIVTLATGRMYASTVSLARALGIDAPLITYNGAYLRAADSDTVLHHTTVDKEHAIAAIRLAASEDVHCSVYIDDTLYVSKDGWESRMYAARCGVQGIYRPDLEDLLSELGKPPTKVLLICDERRTQKIRTLLEEAVSGRAHVTQSAAEYVELVHKEVSKASGLRHLCDLLEVPPEETMAIGDSYNDMEMLRYAGVGVAMANSPEFVKSAADIVVPSNDEDGVAAALDMLL